jgi:hypothetical protein
MSYVLYVFVRPQSHTQVVHVYSCISVVLVTANAIVGTRVVRKSNDNYAIVGTITSVKVRTFKTIKKVLD